MWYTMYDFYQQPFWLTFVLFLALAWSLAWKGVALWYAGKNKQKVWFVVMFILNTLGILPIIYLIWFKPKEGRSIQVDRNSRVRVVRAAKKSKK